MMHTPTPWKVDIWKYPNANPPRNDINIVSQQHLIATVDGNFGLAPWSVPTEEAEANAAFIVNAVNSHDALVEALRFIADQHNHGKAGNWAVEIAKNALAQAEKG